MSQMISYMFSDLKGVGGSPHPHEPYGERSGRTCDGQGVTLGRDSARSAGCSLSGAPQLELRQNAAFVFYTLVLRQSIRQRPAA